ncbi:S1 family peptidase [Prosthecomicrobium hirschii]|uniref:S1 family peptidase n=1 Tax=Prosthecodimorpha hirschii TaxID=665126 RepID=UPI00221F8C34|nr:S1 family peptidase [Prosthecomicrobium hirschii]MCW1843815.1 S1 family peptidase [Prosthecomicrobium hirschii]
MFDERALASLLEQIIVEPFQQSERQTHAQAVDAAWPEPSPGRREIAPKERHRLHSMTKTWRQSGGVRGFGIGEKIAGAQRTNDLAIRIYVEQKQPISALAHPVPSTLELPDFGTIPTDVVEIGRVVAQLDTGRYRPALPGCSIGHWNSTAGTLGCYVRKRGDPTRTYILSNAHVLAINGSGFGMPGDPIVQPGPLDGGRRPHDIIASLAELCPIDFTMPNLVDAAIAEVIDPTVVTTLTARGGPVAAGSIVRTPRRGTKVQKFGRTSDYSVAEILDVNAILETDYETPHGTKKALFTNQIVCTKCSDAGDSGSLITTLTGRPVGLLFAGSKAITVANRISDVLSALDIDILR